MLLFCWAARLAAQRNPHIADSGPSRGKLGQFDFDSVLRWWSLAALVPCPAGKRGISLLRHAEAQHACCRPLATMAVCPSLMQRQTEGPAVSVWANVLTVPPSLICRASAIRAGRRPTLLCMEEAKRQRGRREGRPRQIGRGTSCRYIVRSSAARLGAKPLAPSLRP